MPGLAIYHMKYCPELEELILLSIGEDVVSFFERRGETFDQDVRVFIPVREHSRQASVLN